MITSDSFAPALTSLFAELAEGAFSPGAYLLNPGDAGLLASLDRLTPSEASSSSAGGATIAAHAAHVSYGLSLLNRWAAEGGNPFAAARWDEAWKVTTVDEANWEAIRGDLRVQATRWKSEMARPRELTSIELNGMIGSVAHLAYHLGAIRQIAARARGPKEGTVA